MQIHSVFILIFVCLFTRIYSQNSSFVVVKVHGIVTRSGKPIGLGEKVNSKDHIKYDNSNSFIVAIDDKRSAWILRPKPNLKMFTPDPLPIALGTKPGLLLNYIQLVQFFNHNDTIHLLQGKFRLFIGAKAFPMNEQSFFYIKPVWATDSVIHKLTFIKDTLIIGYSDISLTENTKAHEPVSEPRFALYYYNNATSEHLFINSFYVAEVNEDNLLQEVKMIVQAYSERPQKEIVKMIKTYLDLTYGKFSDYDVDIWLSQHFNMKTD